MCNLRMRWLLPLAPQLYPMCSTMSRIIAIYEVPMATCRIECMLRDVLRHGCRQCHHGGESRMMRASLRGPHGASGNDHIPDSFASATAGRLTLHHHDHPHSCSSKPQVERLRVYAATVLRYPQPELYGFRIRRPSGDQSQAI